MKIHLSTPFLLTGLLAVLTMGAAPAETAASQIHFEKGRISTPFAGTVEMGKKAIYAFGARHGQALSVAVVTAEDNGVVTLYHKTEQLWIPFVSRSRSWSGNLPRAEFGQYRLVVESTGGMARFEGFLGIAPRQKQAVEVTPKGYGKVRFSVTKKKGRKLTKTLDLESSIFGCIRRYDTLDEEMGTYDASHFQVVDNLVREGQYYVLLLASAGSTCNVQSREGYTSSFTLIWLHFDGALRLKKKKVVLAESGPAGVGALPHTHMPFGWSQPEGDYMPLNLRDGRFRLEIMRPREDGMISVDTVSYDQRWAHDGLVTRTRIQKAPPELDEMD